MFTAIRVIATVGFVFILIAAWNVPEVPEVINILTCDRVKYP